MSPKTEEARKTVLVVDDSMEVLLLVATILSLGSYETIESTSASEAMEIAGRNRIDLLISDVEMPEMGGAELVAALKASGAVERCVLISGASMDALRYTYRRDRLVRFVAKPFGAGQLMREIQELFES